MPISAIDKNSSSIEMRGIITTSLRRQLGKSATNINGSTPPKSVLRLIRPNLRVNCSLSLSFSFFPSASFLLLQHVATRSAGSNLLTTPEIVPRNFRTITSIILNSASRILMASARICLDHPTTHFFLLPLASLTLLSLPLPYSSPSFPFLRFPSFPLACSPSRSSSWKVPSRRCRSSLLGRDLLRTHASSASRSPTCHSSPTRADQVISARPNGKVLTSI